jgi:uncharacterized protein YvpB
MKSEKPENNHSAVWITITGIVLAILICMVATSMVFITFSQSTSGINLMLIQGTKVIPLDEMALAAADQATPFQPMELPTATAEPIPDPTPTPTPAPPPASSEPEVLPVAENQVAKPDSEENAVKIPSYAYISGLKGTAQLYTLDCESQSAVDFAKFFGVEIDEKEFIDKLPRSDDPEEGFVGEVNGQMGQFPPDDYGVHAKPVAKLLREYGVPAKAKRDWTFKDIQEEIASGHPVIAWIVNLPFEIDSMEYTASNGNTTTVARFEHTWIIIGYNSAAVTVVDSSWTYNVDIETFMERWEALGKQVIIYREE